MVVTASLAGSAGLRRLREEDRGGLRALPESAAPRGLGPPGAPPHELRRGGRAPRAAGVQDVSSGVGGDRNREVTHSVKSVFVLGSTQFKAVLVELTLSVLDLYTGYSSFQLFFCHSPSFVFSES